MRRHLPGLFLLALLAGCAHTQETCPATLAYVKDRLVTPYPELEKFIGKEALDATLNKPIDQMVAESGGIDNSIAGGERHVKEYQDELKDEKARRTELKNEGMSDAWIDTYILSIKDGVTINQAFVDAVKCRQTRQAEQTQATP